MTSCILDDCDRQMVGIAYCNMHRRRLERNGFVRPQTQADRFFQHVTEAPDGCWIYGTVNARTGYGQLVLADPDTGRDVCIMAHRWAYEYFVADIPSGLVIDHLCRNNACVNPSHLEPVTQRVNVLRGVGSSPTCVNGHPYDTSNTDAHPSTRHRQCRICRHTRERRYAATRNQT